MFNIGSTFFGQSWVKWAAFIILVLSVGYLWTWGVSKLFD